MANTRIAAAGTFSVAQLAAAVGNIVAFTNGTTASITGTVTMSGTGISGSFPLDLEAGETVLLRNNTVNNTYTYAGEVVHTAVNRDIPHLPEARIQGSIRDLDDVGIPTAPGQSLVYVEVYN